MDRRVLLMPVAKMLLAALVGTALLFITIYADTHNGSLVLTLLSLTLLAYSFAVGPVLAFAGEASALWLAAVVWRRKNPQAHIPSFRELYLFSFFGKPLRMVNPPPDEP